jgi:outer membrane protein OmpA-like peptidoglycan-associated protein/tetratricopeptide (TPR) repeat protein
MKERVTFFALVLFLIIAGRNNSFAQDDPCLMPKNKKTQKTYNEALSFINKALEPNSRTPEFFLNQAFPLIREVEKSEPDFAGAQFYLGILYVYRVEKRNLKAAKKYFENSVDLCPDEYPEAWFHLANIAYGEENYEQALKYIELYLKSESSTGNDEKLVEAKMLRQDARLKIDLHGTSVPFQPVVVKGISSIYNDYLVMISPDHELAFYTRQQPVSDKLKPYGTELKYAEKFFVSERLPNGDFDNGSEMGYPFNMRENEGGATVTIDNRELFYTVCEMQNCFERGDYYNCDIYYSKFEFGYWTDIIPLPGKVNNPCTWESQPSISSDGQTLYFVSNRGGGFGEYDIYQSERLSDGAWGEPKNLGKKINTAGREASPFIHSDSQTLYFSSDGRAGMGGYDIFYSKRMDDGGWSEPRNIGYPINTQYDELGFIVSTDGRYGYFSSDRIGLGPGGKDFYAFELYESARPEKVLFIKGEIRDEETSTPMEARVEIRNMETKKVHHVPVDIETGKYVAVLPFKNDYVLTVKKENYVYESMYIAREDSVFEEPVTVNMEIQKVEVGKSYKLNDIYYEYDSDRLTEQSKLIIEEFVAFLNENEKIKVAIHGHTDNVGGVEYNQNLSERRAKSVFDYLLQKGIHSIRLSYAGFGFSKPVASNETESGRALNRRTEFVIISK